MAAGRGRKIHGVIKEEYSSVYRQTKRAVRQTTLEEDINVPDTKQDVGMIIQNKERVVIEQTRTESGQVIFEGYLELAVLYIADTAEKQVQHLETKVRFQEFAAVDGVEPGDAVWVKCEVEDLAVTLINSRKLSMRGILTFQTGADEIYDMAVAVGQQSGLEVCEKTKSLELMQLEIREKGYSADKGGDDGQLQQAEHPGVALAECTAAQQ